MYKNYIFDLYGTLVDIRTNEKKKQLWEKLSLFLSYNGAVYSSIELKKEYFKEVKEEIKENNKSEYPDIKISLVFRKLYKNKGIKVDMRTVNLTIRLFRILSTEYIRLYPGVMDMLMKLKNKQKKIFMLSNGQREFTVPELKYLGIFEYFDGLYSSSDIEICKPDKAFFNYLIKTEKLKKSESIFIGNDDLCDIVGAKAASLECVYIHSNLSRDISKVMSNYEIWDGDISNVIKLTEA